MSNINVSTSDIRILRDMSRDHINKVNGMPGHSQRRYGQNLTSSTYDYSGPFKVSAEFYVENSSDMLKIITAGGQAIGGRSSFYIDSISWSEKISKYKAVLEDFSSDDTLTDDDKIYSIQVIAEMWWDVQDANNATTGSQIIITPSPVNQNRAPAGGTGFAKELPDDVESGAYYARYPLGKVYYKETKTGSNTFYTIYSIEQDQYGTILLASRYI